MRRNFKTLFEENRIFGFYTDEFFTAFLVGFIVAVPIYLTFSNMNGLISKIGSLSIFIVTALVAFAILGVIKAVRKDETKSFYVKLIGRELRAESMRGKFAKAIIYLIAFEHVVGKKKSQKVTKTKNYSP